MPLLSSHVDQNLCFSALMTSLFTNLMVYVFRVFFKTSALIMILLGISKAGRARDGVNIQPFLQISVSTQ